MSLTKKKWEERRHELETHLHELLYKSTNDRECFDYTCQVMASMYNQSFGFNHVEEFKEAIMKGNLRDLSYELTKEEYGEPIIED